jgi:hypothetical protein
MKKISLLIFLGCISLSPGVIFADDWDTSEKVLMATFVLGQTVNYSQANYVINEPGWEEASPWIPEETNKLLLYKAGSTLVVSIVAHFLPHKWRKAVLMGSNAVVWGFVANDFNAGVRFQF